MSIRGTVHWFDDLKGFGFITPDDGGADCFVHHSQIRGPGFRILCEGEQVEFERVESKRGPAAEKVVRVDSPDLTR